MAMGGVVSSLKMVQSRLASKESMATSNAGQADAIGVVKEVAPRSRRALELQVDVEELLGPVHAEARRRPAHGGALPSTGIEAVEPQRLVPKRGDLRDIEGSGGGGVGFRTFGGELGGELGAEGVNGGELGRELLGGNQRREQLVELLGDCGDRGKVRVRHV